MMIPAVLFGFERPTKRITSNELKPVVMESPISDNLLSCYIRAAVSTCVLNEMYLPQLKFRRQMVIAITDNIIRVTS